MSKIDLTKLKSVSSPDDLNAKVLGNAKKRTTRMRKGELSSIRLKVAAAYCFGLLTVGFISFYEMRNSNDTIQEKITSEDIDLSSLQITSRGSQSKKSSLDLDSMSISKLKEIHAMLVQNDDWVEASKLSIYIQNRQGVLNEK